MLGHEVVLREVLCEGLESAGVVQDGPADEAGHSGHAVDAQKVGHEVDPREPRAEENLERGKEARTWIGVLAHVRTICRELWLSHAGRRVLLTLVDNFEIMKMKTWLYKRTSDVYHHDSRPWWRPTERHLEVLSMQVCTLRHYYKYYMILP